MVFICIMLFIPTRLSISCLHFVINVDGLCVYSNTVFWWWAVLGFTGGGQCTARHWVTCSQVCRNLKIRNKVSNTHGRGAVHKWVIGWGSGFNVTFMTSFNHTLVRTYLITHWLADSATQLTMREWPDCLLIFVWESGYGETKLEYSLFIVRIKILLSQN